MKAPCVNKDNLGSIGLCSTLRLRTILDGCCGKEMFFLLSRSLKLTTRKLYEGIDSLVHLPTTEYVIS